MTTPPTPKNIRLTISVSPEVHATFERFSKASGMSLGRAMGEWLQDTLEGAEHLATTLERARAAPKQVARELHAYALGITDETGEFIRSISKKGIAPMPDAHAQRGRRGGPIPPRPVIRGGKSPSNPTSRGQK